MLAEIMAYAERALLRLHQRILATCTWPSSYNTFICTLYDLRHDTTPTNYADMSETYSVHMHIPSILLACSGFCALGAAQYYMWSVPTFVMKMCRLLRKVHFHLHLPHSLSHSSYISCHSLPLIPLSDTFASPLHCPLAPLHKGSAV